MRRAVRWSPVVLPLVCALAAAMPDRVGAAVVAATVSPDTHQAGTGVSWPVLLGLGVAGAAVVSALWLGPGRRMRRRAPD
jgi:drug/metabolite transporter (DMT)-like permease